MKQAHHLGPKLYCLRSWHYTLRRVNRKDDCYKQNPAQITDTNQTKGR